MYVFETTFSRNKKIVILRVLDQAPSVTAAVNIKVRGL